MTEVKWFGPTPDANVMEQAINVIAHPSVKGMALMADNHLGYGVPIGGVIAYKDAVSPSGVGFDIGCGVKAIKTNLVAEDFMHDDRDLTQILDEIQDKVSFGMGRKAAISSADHPVMQHQLWDAVPSEIKALKQLAEGQLGTVGAGNHYVDILVDQAEHPEIGFTGDEPIWVACHFGSRGFGHKTATHFFKRASYSEKDGMQPPLVLRSTDYDFEPYLWSMRLAGAYAAAGRDIVLRQVLNILGATPVYEVHNHHNFAWLEQHQGEDLYVVRKGATPAQPGVQGFVGGSMCDIAAIVTGREGERSPEAFYSTVHGAGRIHSRTWAKGNRKGTKKGNITRQQLADALRAYGTTLRGGDVDESPFVYRKLDEVLQSQGDTITVDVRLRPIGVVMAGADTFDPYKD